MFTGIVEEVGSIAAAVSTAGGRQLKIAASGILADMRVGDSISCSGCCLTVVEFGPNWFAVEAVFETLRRTKLGRLKQGDKLNLERAMRITDRLGGHIVSGHVDAIATVASVRPEGFGKVIEFRAPGDLEPFFIEKGSVTIDGVSLTVASLRQSASATVNREFLFGVALIPHTLEVTTIGSLSEGDPVNIEADIVGKYIARLVAAGHAQNINKGGVTIDLLQQHGYT